MNSFLNLCTLPPSWSTAKIIFSFMFLISIIKFLICSYDSKFLEKNIIPPTCSFVMTNLSSSVREVPSISSIILPNSLIMLLIITKKIDSSCVWMVSNKNILIK